MKTELFLVTFAFAIIANYLVGLQYFDVSPTWAMMSIGLSLVSLRVFYKECRIIVK